MHWERLHFDLSKRVMRENEFFPCSNCIGTTSAGRGYVKEKLR